MNCSFCGTNIQVRSAYCPSCGSPITYEASAPDQAGLNRSAPSSLPQASSKQATPGSSARLLPPSRLSDYKPGGSSESKPFAAPPSSLLNPHSASLPGIGPGSKLSHYRQPSSQPGKLSDYKQPTPQRNKLSDFKPRAEQSNPAADTSKNTDASSVPGLDTFNTAPAPFSAPGNFASPPATPMMANPPSMPAPYPQVPPMMPANPISFHTVSNPANPSSLVPPMGGYTPNHSLPTENSAPNSKPQGRKGGLLLGGIAVILLITCIGAASLFFLPRLKNGPTPIAATTKTVVTPRPTVPVIHGPSGNTSVPTISALFSEPQMSAGLDGSNQAAQVTKTFTRGQTLYVTFTLNSKGQRGYVQARWYKGKQLFREVSFAHEPGRTNGYFSMIYDTPTPDGSVELYWSTTATFSDAKLARVAQFTVSG